MAAVREDWRDRVGSEPQQLPCPEGGGGDGGGSGGGGAQGEEMREVRAPFLLRLLRGLLYVSAESKIVFT
jgi:hypothetical protein